MDWWSGMNACPAAAAATSGVATTASSTPASIFDPWINYDDLDLGAILGQPGGAAQPAAASGAQQQQQPAPEHAGKQQQQLGQQLVLVAPSGAHSDTSTASDASPTGRQYAAFAGPQGDHLRSPSAGASTHLDEPSPVDHLQQQQQQLICSQQVSGMQTRAQPEPNLKQNLFSVIQNHFSGGGGGGGGGGGASQAASQFQANHHLQHQNQNQGQQQQQHLYHQTPSNHHQQQHSSKCSSTGPASTMSSSSSSLELSPQEPAHHNISQQQQQQQAATASHNHQSMASYLAGAAESPGSRHTPPALLLGPNNPGSLLMIDPSPTAGGQLHEPAYVHQQHASPAAAGATAPLHRPQQPMLMQQHHHHHHLHHHQQVVQTSNHKQQQQQPPASVLTTGANPPQSGPPGPVKQAASASLGGQKVRRCRHITDYVLADEEKRLLIKEGYTDFPMSCQTRPLSKSEERILRKIRRKIRNKKSAQCSRQRKKEYVEELERKYAAVVRENEQLKQVLESIEQFQTTGHSQHQLLAASHQGHPHSNHQHHPHPHPHPHPHQHQYSQGAPETQCSGGGGGGGGGGGSPGSLTLEWKDLFGGSRQTAGGQAVEFKGSPSPPTIAKTELDLQ